MWVHSLFFKLLRPSLYPERRHRTEQREKAGQRAERAGDHSRRLDPHSRESSVFRLTP